MKIDKFKIKDDVNFLEYPNWLVSEKEAPKTYVIEKDNGKYVISVTDDVDRLPDRTDKIILYYLMSFLIKNEFKDRFLEVSRYQIAKNALGAFRYDRIMLALKRWHSISISFNGVFYNGDGYSTRYFHIIDNVILKDNKLKIYFNIDFLEQIKNSQYFKLINFNEYKLLKRPVSARLYEILIKTFKDRDTWRIHIIKLAEKLTLEKRKNCDTYYPSDVFIKLQPAVNEITNKTDLKVELDHDKQTHICTFMKLKNAQEEKQKEPNSLNIPEEDKFKALISILPKEHRYKKTIFEAMAKAFIRHGYNYVKRNIEYTNKNCKTNYRAYLNKALKEDFGLGLQEDHEAKQKQSESDKMLRKEYDMYVFNKVEKYKKDNFSEEELNDLYQRISQYYERDNNPLPKEAIIKKTNYYLAQQIGVPLFSEWKKHYNCQGI